MNPVTNNPAAAIRNSFSIENILSKPDRIPQSRLSTIYPNAHNSVLYENYLKNEPFKEYCDENANIDTTVNGSSDDVKSEQSETQNSFTTPDSSCCEDGNDDDDNDMGDVTSDENCKFIFVKENPHSERYAIWYIPNLSAHLLMTY